MSETHPIRISTLSTHRPSHTHHAVHHASHVATLATHTSAPPTIHAIPTSTQAGPTATGFSYPTPSSFPHSSTIIMGLSLGIAFCLILLFGAGAAIFMQRRSAKRKYEERVVHSVYGTPGSVVGDGDGSTETEKKHRTWMGRKIVALVPGNGYAARESGV